MKQPVRTVSPAGEAIVILSADDYDRLVSRAEDVRDAQLADDAMTAYREGSGTALTTDEMRELLAAPTPLAFWRRKRGLSQAALARQVERSQPYLNQLEVGKRRGNLSTFQRLAAALNIGIADLVVSVEDQLPSDLDG